VRLADHVLEHVHLAHRSLAEARWDSGRGDRRTRTWPEAAAASSLLRPAARCNLCGWRGRRFEGVPHSESALCPVCGSIARDRFLYWCWTRRTPYDPAAVVLETSPRLGELYRERMRQRVQYTASDYDGSAHRAAVTLDLQDLDLPDACLDVVLTPHVLEHVPDPDRALAELFRVLRPGGHVLLQVPLPQAVTGVPAEPEYHGDRTLVHFRFGWDLADRIRAHGFACEVLVTSELREAAARGSHDWVHEGDDCDVDDLVAGADAAQLTVVADAEQARRHGFVPAYQFVTFDCRKSG
jgi:SAM-dependent methyltransferase